MEENWIIHVFFLIIHMSFPLH